MGETIKRIKKSFNNKFYAEGAGKIISEKLIQIVDDGSVDNSVVVAKEAGVDIVVSYKPNRRLAYSFKQAVESALRHKVDFFINIDADGQFEPNDIPKLLQPVIEGRLDMVVANRFAQYKAQGMPWVRSFVNQFAARAIGFFLGIQIKDLTCGFRALNREALLRLSLTNLEFTYTQETIIDAIGKRLRVDWVAVQVTYFSDREPKITKSIFKFISSGFKIILKAIRDVSPLKFFGIPSILFLIIGFFGFGVFFYHYLAEFKITPFLNWVVFSSLSLMIGIQFLVFALIADMVKTNRQVTDEVLYRQKKSNFFD